MGQYHTTFATCVINNEYTFPFSSHHHYQLGHLNQHGRDRIGSGHDIICKGTALEGMEQLFCRMEFRIGRRLDYTHTYALPSGSRYGASVLSAIV